MCSLMCFSNTLLMTLFRPLITLDCNYLFIVLALKHKFFAGKHCPFFTFYPSAWHCAWLVKYLFIEHISKHTNLELRDAQIWVPKRKKRWPRRGFRGRENSEVRQNQMLKGQVRKRSPWKRQKGKVKELCGNQQGTRPMSKDLADRECEGVSNQECICKKRFRK